MSPDSTPDQAILDEIRRFEAQYARSPESLVFARLADAYRKAGMFDRALEVVEQGLLRHQGYLSAHIVRGRTLRELGRADAAAAAFHRVLDVDPQNLVALRALGEIARERGRADEAARWYARLAEVDPLDEQVRSTLETLGGTETVERNGAEAGTGEEDRAETGREERAGAEREDSAAAGPEAWTEAGGEPAAPAGPEEDEPSGAEAESDPGLATPTMADLYVRQGLYEEAERIYRHLLRAHPEDAALRQKLEAVRLHLGGVGSGGGLADAASAHTAERETRSEGGRAGRSAPSSPTIRRYLQSLLDGSAEADRDVPRPSAFDAWAERAERAAGR